MARWGDLPNPMDDETLSDQGKRDNIHNPQTYYLYRHFQIKSRF